MGREPHQKVENMTTVNPGGCKPADLSPIERHFLLLMHRHLGEFDQSDILCEVVHHLQIAVAGYRHGKVSAHVFAAFVHLCADRMRELKFNLPPRPVPASADPDASRWIGYRG